MKILECIGGWAGSRLSWHYTSSRCKDRLWLAVLAAVWASALTITAVRGQDWRTSPDSPTNNIDAVPPDVMSNLCRSRSLK